MTHSHEDNTNICTITPKYEPPKDISTPEIHGYVKPGFEPVREIFRQNFIHYQEIGASVCAIRQGETLVDLWAGYREPEKKTLWTTDTVTTIFSCTKGITATAAHYLIQQGDLELDKPVAHYWPEFAASGKSDMPVRWILSHRSGLIGPSHPLPLEAATSWETITSQLATTLPWWTPNTNAGYQAITFGYLVGEIVRRITGITLGAYVSEIITTPLQAQFHIGVPTDQQENCTDVFTLTDSPLAEESLPPIPAEGFRSIAECDGKAAASIAFNYIPLLPLLKNDPIQFRTLESPAVNGQANARGLATIYNTLANGELLKPEILQQASTLQSLPHETDLVLGKLGMPFNQWGLGYMLGIPQTHIAAIGHGGLGGSYGFADPNEGIGYGYVMNHLQEGTTGEDLRNHRLITTLYQSLYEL